MIALDKFRVPIGSLVVDLTMVASLIWWGATITNKLENMDQRVASVENVRIQPEADKRLAVVEAQMGEMKERLQEANRKLDALLAAARR